MELAEALADPLVTVFLAAVLGLVLGSFLNVVILRLPRRMRAEWLAQCRELLAAGAEPGDEAPAPGVATGRSQCPHCGQVITAAQNIPVLSYLLLRGRCASCGARISARYPLVEGLTAVLSVIVVWQLGATWQAAAGLLLTWGLIALAFIDYDHQLLPDAITLPGIWAGLVVNLFGVFTDLPSAVIGAVAGYVALWAVFHLFKLATGKEGMGFGDFKLLSLFGAWLGWQMLPLVILLGALVGAVLGGVLIFAHGRDSQVPMPFGPFLAASGWIAMLWGEEITGAYLQFAGLS